MSVMFKVRGTGEAEVCAPIVGIKGGARYENCIFSGYATDFCGRLTRF